MVVSLLVVLEGVTFSKKGIRRDDKVSTQVRFKTCSY